MNREEQLTAILEQIQSDLADYQRENGIGMRDDEQWRQLFIDRMIANVTDFETLTEKEPIINYYPELPIYANILLNSSTDLIK